MKSIFIIFIFFNDLFINSDRITSKYSLSFLLYNYDIFLVLENGIQIYDYSLTNLKHSHNFTSSQTINSEEEAESIAIAQFPKGDDNKNIVLSLVKNILFVFSNDGEYSFEIDLSDYLSGKYYTLIAYKYDTSFYYYLISYYLNGVICIRYFRLSIIPRQNTQLCTIEYRPIGSINGEAQNIMNYGLSCEIMITAWNKEVISCFYQLTYPSELGVTSFEFSDTSIDPISDLKASSPNDRANIFKSATSEDKKKALICFVKGFENGICLSYNIITNEFSEKTTYFNFCRGNSIGVNVYYFKDKSEYMFICNSNINNKEYKMVTFNDNFEVNVNGDDSLTTGNYKYGGTCYSTKTFSVVYIKGINDYGIINDCEGNDSVSSSGVVPLSNLLGGVNYSPDDNFIIIAKDPSSTNENKEENNNNEKESTEEIYAEVENSLSDTNKDKIENALSEEKSAILIGEFNSKTSDMTSSYIISDILDNKLAEFTNEIGTYDKETDIATNSNIIRNRANETEIITHLESEIESKKTPKKIRTDLITEFSGEIEYKKTEEKKSEKNNTSIMKETIIKKREEILKELDDLINYKEINKSYIIKGEDFTVIIKPINEYTEESSINIDFSECERALKEKNPSSDFIFLQINIENSNKNCLTDQVEYKVYNNKKEIVDLSLCKDLEIKIQYEIKNTSSLNFNEISYFKSMGVDIFNINDDFFNDICYSYSDSDSDLVLKDRVSDIYQNYSLCGSECEYDSFDLEKMAINCNCKVKQEVNDELEKGNFDKYIEKTFLDSNFGVIKCYNLVFNLKGKLDNYGFFLFGILTLIHIPIYILYFINGINPVKNYIIKEMSDKGYEPKKNLIN